MPSLPTPVFPLPPPAAMPAPPQPVAPPQSPRAIPVSTGLAALRIEAATLPCALVLLSQDDAGVISVTGPARQDLTLESFLNHARAGGYRLQVATDPLDPGLCPPIAVLGDAVRRERVRETLRLAMADGEVAAGAPFAATLQGTGGGMLQVDLHSNDGVVHHVMRRTVPSGQWSIRLQATAPSRPGQHMLTAIATARALDLGARPAQEPVGEYLAVLQRELDRAAQATGTAARAEVLLFQVRP